MQPAGHLPVDLFYLRASGLANRVRTQGLQVVCGGGGQTRGHPCAVQKDVGLHQRGNVDVITAVAALLPHVHQVADEKAVVQHVQVVGVAATGRLGRAMHLQLPVPAVWSLRP